MFESVLCLALNIYHEARDQTVDGQLMVAEVTLNRVASKLFPNEVCEVVWQPGAFSWTTDGLSDEPKDTQAFAQAVLIAYQAVQYPDSLLGTDATHYHEKSIHPYWADTLVQIGRLDDHIFYTEN